MKSEGNEVMQQATDDEKEELSLENHKLKLS
jgi:hypothetical protein